MRYEYAFRRRRNALYLICITRRTHTFEKRAARYSTLAYKYMQMLKCKASSAFVRTLQDDKTRSLNHIAIRTKERCRMWKCCCFCCKSVLCHIIFFVLYSSHYKLSFTGRMHLIIINNVRSRSKMIVCMSPPALSITRHLYNVSSWGRRAFLACQSWTALYTWRDRSSLCKVMRADVVKRHTKSCVIFGGTYFTKF